MLHSETLLPITRTQVQARKARLGLTESGLSVSPVTTRPGLRYTYYAATKEPWYSCDGVLRRSVVKGVRPGSDDRAPRGRSAKAH
jgi:hypothetical protein